MVDQQKESESFIQEVDEELRRDTFTRLGKKYGPWLIGAVVAVLAGAGAYEGYKLLSRNTSAEVAESFRTAQEQARGPDAAAAGTTLQEMSTKGPQVFRAMAIMERAGVLERGGDLQAALEQFDAAAEAARDPLLRDTARLRAAYIVAETQDFEAVRTRLQPLIDAEGAISYAARELLAVEAWEAGENDIARDQLNALSLALNAPESVRQRSQLALQVVGRGEAPAPAAPQTPAPAGEKQ